MAMSILPLEKAFAQLEAFAAVADSHRDSTDLVMRNLSQAATIQAFEFTYELSIRYMRKFLEDVYGAHDVSQQTFEQVLHLAVRAGLLDAHNVQAYRHYRDMRNRLFHTYDT